MNTPETPRAPPEVQPQALLDRIARAYAAEIPAATEALDFCSRIFGNYRLIERTGRGGMGDVYRAERADGAFNAPVAVKLLRASIDTEVQTRRFHRERQILARLKHPNIARLLGGGSGPQGIPFLVMEWVDGETITAFAERRALGLEQRLALFEEVCRAVAYAHRNLIVHRDLKPANILVTPDGEVKLLDFGIAKLLDAEDSEDALTRTDALPMTRGYAAPEQILGQSITTSTDVYALGVLLSELLTGDRPHARETHSPAALAAAVDSEIVTRPSEAVRQRAGKPSNRALFRQLKGDLDNIVLKALRREPERRYPSAEALLEDLRRHRDNLPVTARPDLLAYRAGKFFKRHRLGVVAAGLSLLALLAGTAAALWQAEIAREEARRAENAHQLLLSLFRDQDPLSRALLERRTPSEFLNEAAQRARVEFSDDPRQRSRMFTELGELLMNTGDLAQAELLLGEALDLRRRWYGASHEQTARTMTVMAQLERLRGRHIEAGALAQEAAEILSRRLGPDHPDTWRAEEAGIMSLAEAGRVEDAIELSARLTRDYAAHYGEQDPQTAQRWYREAELLERLDRLEPARAAIEQALLAFSASLGERHPRLFPVMVTRADLLRRTRDYRGAAESYRQSIALATLHLGPDHPILAGAYARLADSNRRQGQAPLAAAALDEAERLATAADRTDQLTQVWLFRGRIAAAEEDWEAAISAARQAEALAHKAWGAESSFGLYSSIVLARTLADAGYPEQAAERLAAPSALLQARGFEASMDQVLVAYTLGRIAWSEARLDDALLYYEKLRELQVTINGDNSQQALAVGLLLAEALLTRGGAGDLEAASESLKPVRAYLESGQDAGELSWYELLWQEAATARALGDAAAERIRLEQIVSLEPSPHASDMRRQRAAVQRLEDIP